MLRVFLLTFGGALGTVSRYAVNGLISEHQGKHYPWSAVFPLGTLIVNVSGCFAIGFIAAVSGPAMGRAWLKPEWRDFLMIGFCGGYTTFSTFSLETFRLLEDGMAQTALVNIAVSVVTWLVAVWLGYALASRLNRLKGRK